MGPHNINAVRLLVAENNLEHALNTLLVELGTHRSSNDAILLLGQFRQLKQLRMTQQISLDDDIRQNTRISSALLEMLNDLEQSELTKQALEPGADNTHSDLDAATELLDILDITREAFLAQARIRNLLVSHIMGRMPEAKAMEFESFFATYFDAMTEEEKRQHATIRSYTQHLLSTYNRKALAILQNHPTLQSALPRLKDLEKHLLVWLAKYDGVFHQTPSMSLLYVGVEEAMPFPAGIEEELSNLTGKDSAF